jgi:glycosyltransferase involved in cell wall biosynthesis
MPKFSIIIPCFNAQETIVATIDSIKAQSETDWEMICVDDGSTDLTREMILSEGRNDPRIRLVTNTGKGPSVARNLGAEEEATADLIAFCDADDQWAPYKLRELNEVFADRFIDAVYGKIGFFQSDPSDAVVFSTVPRGDLSIDVLLGENPVCTMSNITLCRRVFLNSGGFDVSMVHNEDLEWLIRLVGQGARVIGLPSLQTWYRTSIGGLSTDLAAMLAGRDRAVQTAARFGVEPSNNSHAIHHRYLARRALRVGGGRADALRHAMHGLAHSPVGFLTPFRRGALTLAGAAAAVVLPRSITRALFS